MTSDDKYEPPDDIDALKDRLRELEAANYHAVEKVKLLESIIAVNGEVALAKDTQLKAVEAEKYLAVVKALNLEEENRRLIEALTPSAETKAAYIGEFTDMTTGMPVRWTTIKSIMKAIRERAGKE